MHKIAFDGLERHLAGRAAPAFYDHLAACGECRSKVEEIEKTSGSLRVLRNDSEAPAPNPYFYAQIVSNIVAQEKSRWRFFDIPQLLVRRVAFSALILLAAAGSFLITSEPDFNIHDAAAIMARQEPDNGGPAEPSIQRDRILLTLASWGE